MVLSADKQLLRGRSFSACSKRWVELQRKEAGDRREEQAGLGSSWGTPALLLALLCLFFHGPWIRGMLHSFLACVSSTGLSAFLPRDYLLANSGWSSSFQLRFCPLRIGCSMKCLPCNLLWFLCLFCPGLLSPCVPTVS
jgi:hypothetical protein